MAHSTDIKDYSRRSWGLEDRPTSEKKIFPEQQIKQKADKIVDKSYKNTKNKNPFTQAAENAKRELSFRLRDDFIENNAGTARLNSVKEAIDINTALDENVQKQKEDDYLKKLKHFGVENSQIKHPDYPKVSNPRILQKNINNQKTTNPTVAKYKAFKEKQQKKIEDKKFDEEFKKEYSDKSIAQWLRAKENKNRIAGKHPYENFSTSNMIVAEDFKDKAKKQLAAIKVEPIKLEPSYIDYRLALKDTGPTISLEEHMAKTAPREVDPPGITALEGAKNFRNIVALTDQKFPTKDRGIGPFISGEDD